MDKMSASLREFDHERNDWAIFKPRLTNHFVAHKIEDKNIRRAMLLSSLSENTYKLVFGLCMPRVPEGMTYEELIKCIDEHFKSADAFFACRYNFYTARKNGGETAREWYARLRGLAAHCKFSAEEIKVILRDMFVIGYENGKIQDRLMEEEGSVTLEQVVQIASSKMAADQESRRIKTEPDLHLMRSRSRQPKNFMHSATSYQQMGQRTQRQERQCKVCGKNNHKSSDCFFKNKSCYVCHKIGHIAPLCRNASKNKGHTTQHFLEMEDDLVFSIENGFNIEPIKLDIIISNKIHKFHLDTGAGISAVPESFYNLHLNKYQIFANDKILHLYDGKKIMPTGFCKVEIKYSNITKMMKLYIIKKGMCPILGRNFISEFGLVLGRNDVNMIENAPDKFLVDKFGVLFEDVLGTFKYGKMHLNLKQGAIPKYIRPRPLPFAMRQKVENELNRLLKMKVIEPINYSAWGTPIVPVLKKDGSIRICGDFKVTINPCLEIDKYPLPRIEELFMQIQGCAIFSKLDLSQAYQQIELDQESQLLCTISTHKGIFKYKRLPYGVASAPAKFQQCMESLLQDVPGTVVFLDDILVGGKNLMEHNERLNLVLSKLENAGFRLSISKCNFHVREVEYLGYKINKAGLKPLKNKVDAIKNAPTPNNVTQLKAFLGMLNYYSKFLSNVTDVVHPLYELLKKGVVWNWTESCKRAFHSVKKLLTSESLLTHFNPELPIKLVTDSSDYGIAAILMHIMPDKTEKNIACVSRTLNGAERKYSQIEKEALSIIFGLTKFYTYLYGNKFKIVTDHNPLISIFNPKKGIPQYSANRLRRWAIYLSAFNYEIEHVKSSENAADALSRLPMELKDNFEEEEENLLFFSKSEIPINFEFIREMTLKDEILIKIKDYVLNCWPKKIIEQLKPYAKNKDEYYIIKDCLFWNNKIVIPSKAQDVILRELHKSHFGIVKIKSIARSYFWWPSMSMDIEKKVANCRNCLENKPNPPKIPLHSWKWPERPWERIHVDYMGPVYGKYFLIVVDAHSKWLEVVPTSNITSKVTIDILRNLISRFGLSDVIVSDNGPAFTSAEFKNFLTLNNIKHITSAPYHPASNGAAENAVKTIKNALKNALGKQNIRNLSRDLNLVIANFLFDYRITPHCTTNVSPAYLMFGRNLITRFDKMNPNASLNFDINKVKNETKRSVLKSQNKQARYYKGNRKVDFGINDMVYFKNYTDKSKNYVVGKIIERIGNCNYRIETGEIKVVRHANQIYCKKENKNQNYCNKNRNQMLCKNIKSIPIITRDTHTHTACSPEENVDAQPTIADVDNDQQQHSISSEEEDLSGGGKTSEMRPQRQIRKPVRYGNPTEY